MTGSFHALQDSARVWVCPVCGQWGREKFDCHRLPENAIDDPETCDGEPVEVELGPFLRHREQRWAE